MAREVVWRGRGWRGAKEVARGPDAFLGGEVVCVIIGSIACEKERRTGGVVCDFAERQGRDVECQEGGVGLAVNLPYELLECVPFEISLVWFDVHGRIEHVYHLPRQPPPVQPD